MISRDSLLGARVFALPNTPARLHAIFRPHMLMNTPYFEGLPAAERDRIVTKAAAISENLGHFARSIALELIPDATREIALLSAASEPDGEPNEILPFAHYALWLQRFNQLLSDSWDIAPRRIDNLCELFCDVIRYDRPSRPSEPLTDALFSVLRGLEGNRTKPALFKDFQQTLEREFVATRILFTATRLARDTGHMLESENFVREASYASFHVSRCLALLLCLNEDSVEKYLSGIVPALLNASVAVRLSKELESRIAPGMLNVLSFGWSPERVRQRVTEQLADCQHRLQVSSLAGAPDRSVHAVRRLSVIAMQWQGLL